MIIRCRFVLETPTAIQARAMFLTAGYVTTHPVCKWEELGGGWMYNGCDVEHGPQTVIRSIKIQE